MNNYIIIILLILIILTIIFNQQSIEHFNVNLNRVNELIDIGYPLFRVASYIEKPTNLNDVNLHINTNNLNTEEKQIRYLEQLERQLKLNEDQLVEDPDLVIDAVGVPIADYETNLKKRYERELQRLSEVDIQYKPKVIDKTRFQVQLERDLEPPEPVDTVQEADINAVDDISKKNDDKINNKTDVSQMLNLLKLKTEKQTHFNKELNKTNMFIKKPANIGLTQNEQLLKLENDIPNIVQELQNQQQEQNLQEENELLETQLDIDNEKKEETINIVKGLVDDDIDNLANNIDNEFLIDESKSLSEIEEEKKNKLFANELATKILNQNIQKDIFKVQDVVKQYFEVSGDSEFNEQVENLF